MKTIGLLATNSRLKAAPSPEQNNVVDLPTINDSPILLRILRFCLPFLFSYKSNLLLYAWVISLSFVSLIVLFMQGQSTQFFGIVDGKEQAISFQYPVDIVSVSVVEGQDVPQGFTVLQVRRNDLAAQLAILEDKTSEISLTHDEYLATTQAELKSLQAKQKASLAELDTQINRLAMRHQLNMHLENNQAGIRSNNNKESNVLVAEIAGLRSTRLHTFNSYQAQIDNLTQQLQSELRPANAQLAELKKRKTELNRQQSDLMVTAPFNSSIGSILFKAGETVEPYKPIITLHTARPNIIKGYIHESVLNKVTLGQSVWIKSLSVENSNLVFKGEVKSLGSRMVEYPNRLLRDLNVQSFGREVVIKLLDETPLLLSEKVTISLQEPKPIWPQINWSQLKSWLFLLTKPVQASELIKPETPEQDQNQLIPIVSHLPQFKHSDIEASGIIKLNLSENFLLLSDEQINKQNAIFMMDPTGQLVTTLALKPNINIDDIESVSQDNAYIYLLASLSPTKNNQFKLSRQLFVQSKKVKDALSVIKQINLYQSLLRFSKSSLISETSRNILSKFIKDRNLDIESHFVKNDSLYLGLKQPSAHNNKILIFEITQLSQLLQGIETHISIWQELDFTQHASYQKWLLSDMTLVDNTLYLLTVNKQKPKNKLNSTDTSWETSALWSFDLRSNQLLKLKAYYHQARAEGLLIDKEKQQAMIVFDGGGNGPSYYFNQNLRPNTKQNK